jgi:hypothetical protein
MNRIQEAQKLELTTKHVICLLNATEKHPVFGGENQISKGAC